MDDLLLEYEIGLHRRRPDRERRRRLAATAAICGLAFVGFGQLSTAAVFDDNATFGYDYSSGAVELGLGNTTGANSKDFALPDFGNRAPGDTDYQSLRVNNRGDLKLRYTVKGETTSDVGSTRPLSEVLAYDLYSVSDDANCNRTGLLDPGSTRLTSSPVTLPDGSGPVGLVGGPDARELNAGTGEWLCLRIDFDLSADSRYTNGTAKVRLLVNAVQTRNNP